MKTSFFECILISIVLGLNLNKISSIQFISNSEIEHVNYFKFMGTWVDENDLWSRNTDIKCKKNFLQFTYYD